VERNRLKRRLKELLRLELLPVLLTLAPSLDVVLRVSPLAYTRTYDALARDMRHVAEKLRERHAGSPNMGRAVTPSSPDDVR
jgi:ribonuclease P protein component